MTQLARILIVDDNPKYLQDALPMYGYEVKVATDGVQALRILAKVDNKENSFDLILLDVMMPNMNGWDALKSIRSNPKTEHIPVMIMTSMEIDDETRRQLDGFVVGLMKKSGFTKRDLLNEIAAINNHSV